MFPRAWTKRSGELAWKEEFEGRSMVVMLGQVLLLCRVVTLLLDLYRIRRQSSETAKTSFSWVKLLVWLERVRLPSKLNCRLVLLNFSIPMLKEGSRRREQDKLGEEMICFHEPGMVVVNLATFPEADRLRTPNSAVV